MKSHIKNFKKSLEQQVIQDLNQIIPTKEKTSNDFLRKSRTKR